MSSHSGTIEISVSREAKPSKIPPVKITYAHKHKWLKPLVEDPTQLFGKSARSRIHSALRKASNFNIRTEIKDLDDSFFTWFKPQYEEQIGGKANPVVFDIYGKTLGNTEAKWKYHSLTLFENDIPLGGTIFSVRSDLISVAYRAYKNDWQTAQLQANPSLYTEYIISKHGYELGKKELLHGRDRNPYGLNSNIGLAGFKLAVGCQPHLSSECETSEIELDDIESDALVLQFPKNSKLITEAHLVVSKESEGKYLQVTKYPERLHVTVHYRNP